MSTSQSKAELVKRAVARRELDKKRFSEDPFAYIFEVVQTKDEHDSENPVKLFPKKEYLYRMLDIWHSGESVEFLIKSRQLMVTWLACAYISWVARYHPHRLVFVQSKKEEDASNLVFHTHSAQARLSFIETHLPEYLRIKDLQYAYGKVIYPNGSRVQAIPQGPTHYESYVPSLVFNDEASLQDEWAAGHAALKPCIEGGGKCITVATVRIPSAYSEELRLDDTDTEAVAHGIRRYRSNSGVAATALHYSADPAKDPETEDGSQWYQRAISGYPGGPDGHLWRQHMELDFEATSSTKLIPFFEEYERVLTIPDIPPEQQIGWKYYAGFDYGKRNKTVFGVYAVAPDGTRYICWELAAPGDSIGGIPGITRHILDCPYFEDVRHNIRADPTIWNDNQAKTSGGYTSIAQLLSLEGIYLQKAPVKGNAADEIAIERLLHYYWVDPAEPKLFMFRSCRQHITQFKGLRYQDWSAAVQSERSYKEELVDRQNDTWDAWKYAECARPSPAVLNSRPPVGSVEHIRRKMVAEKYKPRRVKRGEIRE